MLRLGIDETSSSVSAAPHPQLWKTTRHADGTVAQEAGKKSMGTPSQPSSDHVTTPFELGGSSSINTQPRIEIQESKGDFHTAKLRRLEANREASRKSRMKKVQYLVELERSVKILEAEVAVLTPQVAYYREQKNMQELENKSMRKQIETFATTSKLNEALIARKKEEAGDLKHLYMMRQTHRLQKMASAGMLNTNLSLKQPLLENLPNTYAYQGKIEQQLANLRSKN
ncbi:Basic-leucine zipper domain [Dillenia turbinata]|uniref:Basic-leucine zipper domain n=1 Tax=Dillenia turbinata TaxID=194707 RepID=A0AAN8V8V8_9MAGN